MGFLSSEKRALVSQLKSIDFDPKAIYKFQGGVDNIQQIFSGNSYFSQALDFTEIKITGDGGLDNFGSRVEINTKGDIAFICAKSDPTNNFGSVYIYKKNNTNWEFKQKIVGQFQSSFGNSISSNFDGTTFVVGAPGAAADGRAYVYTGNGNSWSSSAVLAGNLSTFFGTSVSINSSGNVIAVGAINDREFCSPFGSICGAVHIFTGSTNNWILRSKFSSQIPSINNSNFGEKIKLNDSGNKIIIGAPAERSNSGAAYLFDVVGGVASLPGKRITGDLGNDGFGTSVSIDGIGETVVVGARNDTNIPGGFQGAAFVFTGSSQNLFFAKKLSEEPGAFNYFGTDVKINQLGDKIIVGGTAANNFNGAAWIYTGEKQNWGLSKKISGDFGSNDLFGVSVGADSKGSNIIIGAESDNNQSGAAWIFSQNKSEGFLYKEINTIYGLQNENLPANISLNEKGDRMLVGISSGIIGGAKIYYRNQNGLLDKNILLSNFGATSSGIGGSVKLNSLGDIAIIGARLSDGESGKAFIFIENSGSWNLKSNLNSIGNNRQLFGLSLDVNSSGNIIIVGAPQESGSKGSIGIYTGDKINGWNLSKKIGLADADKFAFLGRFGDGLAINDTGNILAIGVPSYTYNNSFLNTTGAVFIYTGNNFDWNLNKKIVNTFSSTDYPSNLKFNLDGTSLFVSCRSRFGNLSGFIDIYKYSNLDENDLIVSNTETSTANGFYERTDRLYNGKKTYYKTNPVGFVDFVIAFSNVNSKWNIFPNLGTKTSYSFPDTAYESISPTENPWDAQWPFGIIVSKSNWGFESRIQLDESNYKFFGTQIAINNSGNLLFSTAYKGTTTFSGDIFAYKNINSSWQKINKFTGNQENNFFGSALDCNGEGNILTIGAFTANQGSGFIKEFENKNISIYEQGSLSGYKRNLAFDGERWTDFNQYKNNNYNIPQDSLITLNTEQNINIQPNVNSKFSKYREGEFFHIRKKDAGGGEFVFKKLNQLNEKGFFPALGNHDYDDADGTGNEFLQYFSFLKNIKGNTSGKEKYYDFKIKNCHFFVLDSDPVVGGNNKDGNIANGAGKGNGNPNTTSNNIYVAQQKAWFNNAIKNSTSKYKFVFFHHPCYSSGPVHGGHPRMSIEQGWKFHLADFVFHGHEHLYERSKRTQTQQYPIYPNFVFTRLSSTQLKIEYYFPGIAWNTTQLRINIGHDDWQDIIVQANMYKNNNNGWEYIYTFPEGSDTVNFAVRTNGGIWDNNTIGGQAYNYIYYLNDTNDFSKTRFIINGNGGVGLYDRITNLGSINEVYFDDIKSFNFSSAYSSPEGSISPGIYPIKKLTKRSFSNYVFLSPSTPIFVSDPFGTQTSTSQNVIYLSNGSVASAGQWALAHGFINPQTNSLINSLPFIFSLNSGSNSYLPTEGWSQFDNSPINYTNASIFKFENLYRKNSMANIYGFSKISIYQNGILFQHLGIKKDQDIFSVFDEDSVGNISESEKELEFAIIADWGIPNNGEQLTKPVDFSNPGNNYYVEKISKEIKKYGIPYVFAVGDLNYVSTPLTRQNSNYPFYIDENIGRFYSEYINCYRGAYQNGLVNGSLLSDLKNTSVCEIYKNYYPPLEKQYALDYKVINYFSPFEEIPPSTNAVFAQGFDINESGDKIAASTSCSRGVFVYVLNKESNSWQLNNQILSHPLGYSNTCFGYDINMSKDGNTTMFSSTLPQPYLTSGGFIHILTGNNFYNSPQSIPLAYRSILPDLRYANFFSQDTWLTEKRNVLSMNYSGNKCVVFYKDSRLTNGGFNGVINLYENIFPNTSEGIFRSLENINEAVSYQSHWKLTGQKVFETFFKTSNPFISNPKIKINNQGDLVFLSYLSGDTSNSARSDGIIEIYSGNNLNFIDKIISPNISGEIYYTGFLSVISPSQTLNNTLGYSFPEDFDINTNGDRIITLSKLDSSILGRNPSNLDGKEKFIDNIIHVYDLSGSKWVNTAKIADFTSGYNFAKRIAMCKDNENLILTSGPKVLGKKNEEMVSLYTGKNDRWELLQKFYITGNYNFAEYTSSKIIKVANNGKVIAIPFDYSLSTGVGGIGGISRGIITYISGEVK